MMKDSHRLSRPWRIVFRTLLFLYLGVLLVLCFGKFEQMPEVPQSLLGIPLDKVVHFLMFFPFPILLFLAYDALTESVKASALYALGALGLGVLLAFLTEWGQAHFTSYRSGDLTDLLADCLALLLSALLVFLLDIRKQRAQK